MVDILGHQVSAKLESLSIVCIQLKFENCLLYRVAAKVRPV